MILINVQQVQVQNSKSNAAEKLPKNNQLPKIGTFFRAAQWNKVHSAQSAEYIRKINKKRRLQI